MHWIQKSVYEALDEDEARLFPSILMCKDNPLVQESLIYYDRYKLSFREYKLYQKLGAKLSNVKGTLKILDVGSGKGMTSYVLLSMIKDIDVEYVSIDKSQ